MAAMNEYDVGDVVKMKGTFKENDVVKDPPVVRFLYAKPGSTTVTLVYGTDLNVIRDSEGVYHVDMPINTGEHGTWYYRAEGWTVDVPAVRKGAGESAFSVAKSNL
jgi:hypothetical protein